MRHQLHIHHLANRCCFLGKPQDVPYVTSEINQLFQHATTQTHDDQAQENPFRQISHTLEKGIVEKIEQQSVIHIRKMALRLTLDRQCFSSHSLSSAFADQLTKSVNQQLNHLGYRHQLSENIVVFKCRAQFIGSFIRDLFNGSAWHRWYYEEFQVLKHLTVDEATVQLLLPRLQILPELLQPIPTATLKPLIARLNTSQSLRLFRQWTGVNQNHLFKPEYAPAISRLKQAWQHWQQNGWQSIHRAFSQAENSLPQNSIQIFLTGLQNGQSAKDPEALLWLTAHYEFLRYHNDDIPTLVDSPTPPSPTNVNDNAQVHREKNNIKEIAHSTLLWVEKGRDEALYIHQLQQSLASENPPQESQNTLPSMPFDTDKKKAIAHGPTPINSQTSPPIHHSSSHYAHAGLVCLIPIVCSMQLHTMVSLPVLQDALVFAGGESPEHSVPEKWLQSIFAEQRDTLNSHDSHDIHNTHSLPSPVEPTSEKQPSEPSCGKNAIRGKNRFHQVIQQNSLGLTQEQKLALEQYQGAEQIGQLLLFQFASRLSGLQLSSNEYLRRQFLHKPGHMEFSNTHIHAWVTDVPLAIVLRMSGFARWSQKLPWSDKTLTIEVTEP